MEKILDKVNSPDDLKELDTNELRQLAKEIREFLVINVSKTGGHLASNLGIVEITMALHYVFNSPKDKIVWDVGHQSYIHKILTGRKNDFKTLRKFKGLSGFPRPDESVYDAFGAGHSSTSISAALGIACARDILGENNKVIAVIGDGSMTGGLAFEGLNNAGRSNRNLIVILNDNQMSISKNVGAISRHLNDIRTEPAYLDAKEGVHTILDKVPFVGHKIDKAIETAKNKVKYMFVSGIMFEEMGFKYVGPIDGNNIDDVISVLKRVKNMEGPILIHAYTKKGKGYKPAEENPCDFHGIGAFDIKSGKPIGKSGKIGYSQVFGRKMVELAKNNKRLLAVSAAMTDGTGLQDFEKCYPKRFFDVGIAEQHAVTFCAGLAKEGFTPVFAVYSTFLQRAYDQIIHDVCLQNLHVVFAIDRAGIVGADGETHQGIFDLSFLTHMPNMTVLAPKNGKELEEMLEFAVNHNGPIAIRYPRGSASEVYSNVENKIEFGKSELISDGNGIALIPCGEMMNIAEKVQKMLIEDGKKPMVVNPRFIKPLDIEMLKSVSEKCKYIFTMEDNLVAGGFGECVLRAVNDNDIISKVYNFGFKDCFVEHGSTEQLFEKYGLDADNIYKTIKSIVDETDE